MQSVIKGGWTYRVENPVERYVSALRELAGEIRTHSWAFARHGPGTLSPEEANDRQREILAVAAEVEQLAAAAAKPATVLPRVTVSLEKLHKLGFFPDSLLVENAARAFVSAEKFRDSEQIASSQGEADG